MVSAMKWTVVQKRIRKIWPEVAKLVPEGNKGRRRRSTTYKAPDAFEAMLYLLWHNTSMREYPSAACLCRTVSPWLESRALDKLWTGYLAELSKKELLTWREQIERNRQGKRKHGGFSLAVSWCLILWRVLEDTCKSKGGGREKASGTKEWAACNVNVQKGCEHGCLYCYAHGNAGRFKKSWAKSWTTPSLNRSAIAKAYKKKHEKPVMFPSSHDITEANLADCLTVLKKLLAAGNRVLIVSKPHLNCIKTLCRELDGFKGQVLFRFSIGSADDAVLTFWEPHAPNYRERLDSLKWAFKQGYKTSVSCEPMLDGHIQRVIDDARDYVTDSIWLGRVNRIQNCLTLNAPGNHDAKRKAAALMELQNDLWIMGLYMKHKDDPLIRYKDSIKQVVGLERPDEAGLDQ